MGKPSFQDNCAMCQDKEANHLTCEEEEQVLGLKSSRITWDRKMEQQHVMRLFIGSGIKWE